MQKLETSITIEFTKCSKEEAESDLHKDQYINNGYLSHCVEKPEFVNREDFEYRQVINKIAKNERLLVVKRLKVPPPPERVKFTPKDLIHAILCYYDTSKAKVFKQCRKEDVRSIRQIIQAMIYFCSKRDVIKKHLSLADIGEMTGFRDHSTILNSIKRVCEHYEAEKVYRESLDKLMEHLKIRNEIICMLNGK